jgi:ABC-type multidrug transport system fused ATPase/permease subunit
VFLAVLPVVGIIATVYAKFIQPRIKKQLSLLNQCSVTAAGGFHNLRTVKLFNMECEEIRRFKNSSRAYYYVSIQNLIFGTLFVAHPIIR